MKTRIALFFAVLFIPLISHAGLFGPSNYEECILSEMKSAKSDRAASAIAAACYSKFPPKAAKETSYDYPGLKGLSALGAYRPTLDSLLGNLTISHVSTVQQGTKSGTYTSYDYGHYLSVEVLNRNDFSVDGLDIGIPKYDSCSFSDTDYDEIFACKGGASARTSGVFKCDIPRLENRNVNRVCITGLYLYTTYDEVMKFMKRYKIPARK